VYDEEERGSAVLGIPSTIEAPRPICSTSDLSAIEDELASVARHIAGQPGGTRFGKVFRVGVRGYAVEIESVRTPDEQMAYNAALEKFSADERSVCVKRGWEQRRANAKKAARVSAKGRKKSAKKKAPAAKAKKVAKKKARR